MYSFMHTTIILGTINSNTTPTIVVDFDVVANPNTHKANKKTAYTIVYPNTIYL